MQYKVEISTTSVLFILSLVYCMQGTYKMERALAFADAIHAITAGRTEIWGTFV